MIEFLYVKNKAFSYSLDQVSLLKSEKMNMKIESPKSVEKSQFALQKLHCMSLYVHAHGYILLEFRIGR